MRPILQLFSTAVKKVTTNLIKDFHEISYLQISNPGSDYDYARQTEAFVEKKLYEDLKNFKPEYCYILGSGLTLDNKDDSNRIIINSIVGFDNFKRSIPYFAVSLGLIRDNSPFAGVVYHPLTSELFMAEKGHGALYNQRKLRTVATKNKINDTLIAINKPTTRFDSAQLILTNCPTLDLCYASSGKFDLCFFEGSLKFLPLAASLVIAKEAGCKVTYGQVDSSTISNLIVGDLTLFEKFKLL